MITKELAPIVFFVYKRPEHTIKTLNRLAENDYAKDSVIYIYADGPKQDCSEKDYQDIREVRNIVKQIKSYKNVTIVESEQNIGLGPNMVKGVTEVVNLHGKVIVLEDDLYTSKGFLKYQNDSLKMYQDDERVMQISSFVPNHKGQEKLPETFFLCYMEATGFGTWKRAWDHFKNDSLYFIKQFENNNEKWNKFNLDNSRNFLYQFDYNIKGISNNYAINWYSSIFFNNGLILYPNQSMINHIGWGKNSTNMGKFNNSNFDVDLKDYIEVKRIDLEESKIARDYFRSFYYARMPLRIKIKKGIQNLLSKN